MAVSLGTVFVLNSIALLIFPPLGHYHGLTTTYLPLVGGLSLKFRRWILSAEPRQEGRKWDR